MHPDLYRGPARSPGRRTDHLAPGPSMTTYRSSHGSFGPSAVRVLGAAVVVKGMPSIQRPENDELLQERPVT
ncbi:hypothetical protein GCM10008944_26820 [Cytobacillus oceanisediminis]